MKTDVTLEHNGDTLIIDTKYYSEILRSHPESDKKSIQAAHLYQIFSYVKNKAAQSTNEVSGLLLYAKTDEETFPDSCCTIIGNKISVKTLDLNQDFRSIQEQLNGILKEWDDSLIFPYG
jgi:5-methylcytosine-specific restriction enzyme subunit McrC